MECVLQGKTRKFCAKEEVLNPEVLQGVNNIGAGSHGLQDCDLEGQKPLHADSQNI